MNLLPIFEKFGVDFQYVGDSEVKTKCPFHSDNNPSCFVNTDKLKFKCHTAGCEAKGDIIDYFARVSGQSRTVTEEFFAREFNYAPNEKIVQPEVIEKHHNQIWQAGALLTELRKRAVSDAAIRHYRLGEDKGNILIPIRSATGNFVALKRYNPTPSNNGKKFANQRGRGANRLFPIDQLQYSTILYCGGELKAIVAAEQLNPLGIGAISPTAGEGNHDAKLLKALEGKTVYVCMDIDEAGQLGADAACRVLYRIASWVGNLVLPLDSTQYPKGDINDYIAAGGNIFNCLQSVEQWKPSRTETHFEQPVDVALSEAIHADNTNKRVRIKAFVTAVDNANYAIPKSVVVDCDKQQKCCQLCPIYIQEKNEISHIPAESPAVLGMVNTPVTRQKEIIQDVLQIPKSCKVCSFEPRAFYNAQDVRVSAQLEITNRAADTAPQPAVCIGVGLEPNESYEMVGRMLPHPLTQQSTLLISSYQMTSDALTTYRPDTLEDLRIFGAWENTVQGVRDALNRIYSDLESNVTRIVSRRLIHYFTDLAYHSPLFLPFENQKTPLKGWVETLIIGDSSQGKSQTAMGLLNHYGLGEKVECKNATVAGLLGGLLKSGDRWWVSWGVIPTHDKRLVILEELKGASIEVIGRLTDMRSSGKAELPKIEKRMTYARTRLLAMSNPRGDKSLAEYSYGIEAVKELIGSLEDIRRFDAVLLVAADEVSADVIHAAQQRSNVPHLFTGELCRKLILWAWTRKPEQIVFESENYIRKKAAELCAKYTDAIPIIDRGSMRHKLARLAASTAARVFSNDGVDLETLQVRNAHVDFVVETLDKVYSAKAFGYKEFTIVSTVQESVLDPQVIELAIKELSNPREFCALITRAAETSLADIQDWTGLDRDSAQRLLSLLVRKHALRRDKRVYRKTSGFIEMLKTLMGDDSNLPPDRPDYLKDEF